MIACFRVIGGIPFIDWRGTTCICYASLSSFLSFDPHALSRLLIVYTNCNESPCWVPALNKYWRRNWPPFSLNEFSLYTSSFHNLKQRYTISEWEIKIFIMFSSFLEAEWLHQSWIFDLPQMWLQDLRSSAQLSSLCQLLNLPAII